MIRSILKTGFRNLFKNPFHSISNILGLAVALATVILISLWVHFHSTFDTMHNEADRIYRVMGNMEDSNGEIQTSQGAVFRVMDEAKEKVSQIDEMTRLISYWRWPAELCFRTENNRDCIYQHGIYSDSSFFNIFDFEIVKGDPNPLKEPGNIAISESMAAKLFGNEEPLGKTYEIDEWKEVQIAAIFKDVPDNSSLQFDFIAPLEVCLDLWGQTHENIRNYSFLTYIKLVGGSDPEIVESQISNLTSKEDFQGIDYILQPLGDIHLYSNFSNGRPDGGMITYLRIFILFAAFLFLMAAVNFINLSTARASLRSKEVGIRKVTGATKNSLVAQFLIEAFVKVLTAMGLALLIVNYTLPMINHFINESLVFVFDTFMISLLVSITMLFTFLAGTYPAFVISKFQPIKAIKSMKIQGGRNSLRKWLTIIQISFSVAIILVTIVVYRQIDFIQTRDLGYDRTGVMRLEPTYEHIKQFGSFKTGLLSNSLIKGVGVSNSNLLDASFTSDEISWSGKNEENKVLFKIMGVDQGFLETFGLDLQEGNGFNVQDSSQQVILTESASRVMGLEKPTGSILSVFGENARVVGVVNDFVSESLHELMLPVILHQVTPEHAGTVYIKYDESQPKEAIDFIRQQYNIYEDYFTMKYSLLDKDIEEMYSTEAVIGRLSSGIMIISLTIALVGLLGLSSYNMVRRYKEIAIRKVFGASSFQIIAMFSRDFIVIALIANIIAWPVSIYLIREWLEGFAYRVSIPYLVFGLTVVLVIIMVVLLIAFQSYKVATLNPSEVINDE